MESRYLESCWEKCLENIIIIPTMVMWTDNGRLIPNNLKYAAKFEGNSSVTSDRIGESNNDVNSHIMTKDDMEFRDVITVVNRTNNYDANIVETSEAAVHATNNDEVNDDPNKTVTNESEIKERIISLKPKKEKEFPHISEMKSQLYTKTAILLQEKQLINKFDTRGAKFKHRSRHNHILIEDYVDSIAQIEVKSIKKEMDLQEELGREQWEK